MPVRKSHKGRYPEPPVADELPSALAAGAEPLATGRVKGRIADPALARRMARMPRRRAMMPASLPVDERFEPFDRMRKEWIRRRSGEYLQAFGAVSYGVSATLNAAGWAYATGEYANALAAQTGDLEFAKTAANLTTTARGHDRMAWEMACKEAETRPAADPHAALARVIASKRAAE